RNSHSLAPSSTIKPAKLNSHARKSRPHNSGSAARSQLTSHVKPVAAKWHRALPGQRRSICSFNSVRFISDLFCQGGCCLRQQIMQRSGNVKSEHKHRHSRQKQRQSATERQFLFFFSAGMFVRWRSLFPFPRTKNHTVDVQHHTEKCDDDEDGEKTRRQIMSLIEACSENRKFT